MILNETAWICADALICTIVTFILSNKDSADVWSMSFILVFTIRCNKFEKAVTESEKKLSLKILFGVSGIQSNRL